MQTETAVRTRYTGAARAPEAAHCCPVEYDKKYLEVIPREVIEKDYGCGDPSRHVREGVTVLDLGSGAGKICFIAAQVVGPTGKVIGVDMTDEMLAVARRNAPIVAERLGYTNVEFRKGQIQDLALDLELLDRELKARQLIQPGTLNRRTPPPPTQGKTMKQLCLTVLLLTPVLATAQTNTPALKVGDAIPDETLRTEENKEVKLRELIAGKPTVLIFYRGGWCPYCNRHLQALVSIEKDLLAAGAQLFAISPDQPSKLKETPDRDKLGYRLLSDSDAVAAQAFGLAFKVDDATVEKYKTYKIDLDAASGKSHHLLPHPAVFVTGTNGVIRFAHINPDYKVRLEPEKVLKAAQAAKE